MCPPARPGAAVSSSGRGSRHAACGVDCLPAGCALHAPSTALKAPAPSQARPGLAISQAAVQAIETTSGDWSSVDARIQQAEADSALLKDLLQKAARTHQVSCIHCQPLAHPWIRPGEHPLQSARRCGSLLVLGGEGPGSTTQRAVTCAAVARPPPAGARKSCRHVV